MSIPKELLQYVISFDTETAILGDHVVEIGLSIFKNGQLHREWGTFVKPTVPIDPRASEVHNIYASDLEESPLFADIAPVIYNFLNSADIHAAYNYEYDRRVLVNEFTRLGMDFPLRPMVDPYIFFKKYHKFRRGKKLTDAAEQYGIPYVGAHRATNDSTMAGKVLFKMAATKVNFPKNLSKLIQQQRTLVEAQYLDFYKYRQSKGQELPTQPNYSFFEVAI